MNQSSQTYSAQVEHNKSKSCKQIFKFFPTKSSHNNVIKRLVNFTIKIQFLALHFKIKYIVVLQNDVHV